jgi:multicomponent Na+:H+ antiporter subunit E
MRVVALITALFLFWLLLSGIYTPFLVLSGLGCSIVVAAFAWRMGAVDPEGHPVDLTLGAIAYWPWLIKEIAVCGWQVTRIIVHPRLPISPTLTRFSPSQTSTVGLVTHANSITLTPGTITVEAERESFVVHSLTRAGAEGLAGSEMDRRVSRMEGGA